MLTSSTTAYASHTLTPDQISRYSRQLLIPAFGPSGQAKLLASSALVVGAGGLGSPLLLYLAAAGVGTLGIIDHDTVDESNLQRQVIHTHAAIGHSKAESAARAVSALNPTIECRVFDCALDRTNALAIVGGFDLVLDASDNPGNIIPIFIRIL